MAYVHTKHNDSRAEPEKCTKYPLCTLGKLVLWIIKSVKTVSDSMLLCRNGQVSFFGLEEFHFFIFYFFYFFIFAEIVETFFPSEDLT